MSGMEYMTEIKENLCEELKQFSRKSHYDKAEVDCINMLVNSIYKMDKMGSEHEGGSYRGGSYRDGSMGSYRGSYDGGSSEARGQHYVRGHYSYDDEKMSMANKLEEMISSNEVSGEERRILRQAMEVLNK